MLPLTTIRLLDVMRDAGVDRAAAFIGPLNQALIRWGITTNADIAAFLAQAAHESSQLRRLEENLNYSAEALVRVWPQRFTREQAEACAHQPEKIANKVYCARLGNGDEASGDGWRFRGRGIFQLTGRRNYQDCSIAIAGDADTLLMNPEFLAEPAYACESAGWFWHVRGLSGLAERGGFEEITRRINGGLNGLNERVAFWNRAIAMLIEQSTNVLQHDIGEA
jgi:putative chitinase